MKASRFRRMLSLNFGALSIFLFGIAVTGQQPVTSPEKYFGHRVGEDYQLFTYAQFSGYWKLLEKESPRFKLVEIGKTEEGRPQYMAIVTSPANMKKLDEYKEISRKLALAEGITDEEARHLSQTGKPVVWIDGGLHANEVVGAHQLIELSWQLTSMHDPETLRFLDDLVILLVHLNPDGMELVSSWYMREKDPLKRSTSGLPRLYQKYIGHDNNRDHYMVTQKETENEARIEYREWFPQIMYNHHQTGPNDLIVFVPPFRDPPNYHCDPLVNIGNQAVGISIHNRLIAGGKAGSGMRKTANYSTWYNGSIRTTAYFHNEIGMLTEIKGNPTPVRLAFYPDRQLQTNDMPLPYEPRVFHFREAIEYSMTMDRAVLDYASKNKESVLYNRYLMAENAIEQGSKDSWTVLPENVDAVIRKIAEDTAYNYAPPELVRRRGKGYDPKYFRYFRLPENRDPRGYILPSGQPDFPTATKFVNTLIKNGVTVLKAEEDFSVGNKEYPKGSYIVKCAQAFRSHILDMFEPQNYPNDLLYAGGPPIPPYDNAGYNLSYQMGIRFDRILEGFDGPFRKIDGLAQYEPGTVAETAHPAGYLLSYGSNNAVIAVNRALKKSIKVLWLKEKTKEADRGAFFFKTADRSFIESLARDLGISFTAQNEVPRVVSSTLSVPRIGLWDRYGGSIPSGWARWLMEQFEFPFEVIYPERIDAGNLNHDFDILIFVDGAIPSLKKTKGAVAPYLSRRQPDPASVPKEYRDRLGRITAERSIPQIEAFLKNGGTVITTGSSTDLAYYLGLPVSNHMVNSKGEPLKTEDYYLPSSIVRIRLNTDMPVTVGLPEHVDCMFSNSPVFRLKPGAGKLGITPVGWFDSDRPLRSGWAWGQDRLYGGTTMLQAKVGKGKLFLFGPGIIKRAQSHGTFKLFFNGLYISGEEE
ncbi:MAG: peptidase [Chlorobi bacterium]|nr:peptidase [Chlorobiota bacterium]